MEEVEQLCDSVAVIDHGRVVLHERMEHLLRREGGQALHITLAEPTPAAEQLLQDFKPTHTNHTQWSLTVPHEKLAEVLALLERAGATIERVQYGVSRLEEIYLHLLLSGAPAEQAA